jgi:hypothetical protein
MRELRRQGKLFGLRGSEVPLEGNAIANDVSMFREIQITTLRLKRYAKLLRVPGCHTLPKLPRIQAAIDDPRQASA